MTVGELIAEIKKASYLSNSERENWLKTIPKMTVEQLTKLAGLVIHAKEAYPQLLKGKGKILQALEAGFAGMNKYALNKGRKELRKHRSANNRKSLLKNA